MKRYWHIYTKGLEDDLIFRCEEDFVVGMNYVPVALHGKDIVILAFVLMTNHFHFIVCAREDVARQFIETYKNLVSRYVYVKYSTSELLKGVNAGISMITETEKLKEKIAYVLNNPVAAGINCFPQRYEWGSGECYFAGEDRNGFCVPLSSYQVRVQRKMLRSHTKLPQSYLVSSGGYVTPSSYVDWQAVENLYYRASSLQYYLNMSRKNNDVSKYSLVFSDELLLNVVSQMLEKQYGGLSVKELHKESLAVLVRELNRRMNSPAKQLARVLGLSVADVVSILKN